MDEFYGEHFYEQPTSHFIYGDSTDVFYWACQLAQTYHSQYGQDVFMTSATKKNFMEGYQGEGCLVLLGLNPQDIWVTELWKLLRPAELRSFMQTDVSHVHTVIFTSHYDIEALAVGYRKRQWAWKLACGAIDHIYEVRNAGSFGVANVTTYQYKPSEMNDGTSRTLEVQTTERDIDLLRLIEKQNTTNSYFETYDYRQILVGLPEEVEAFLSQVRYLPFSEQQKLWAMVNSRREASVSTMFARHCLKNLRSCEYDPSLRTLKDCGFKHVTAMQQEYLKSELQPYVDFVRAGKAWLKMDEQENGILTPLGYIKDMADYNPFGEFSISSILARISFMHGEKDGTEGTLSRIEVPF